MSNCVDQNSVLNASLKMATQEIQKGSINCKADAPLENCKGLRCDSRLSLVANTSEMKEHISTASLLPSLSTKR